MRWLWRVGHAHLQDVARLRRADSGYWEEQGGVVAAFLDPALEDHMREDGRHGER